VGYFKFRRARKLLAKAGYRILNSDYDYWTFGNWFIDVQADDMPLQRVLWDGRDKWLYVQFFGSRDLWWDMVVIKERRCQSAEEVMRQITKPITEELQAQREREQDEYWAEQVRGGWVITDSRN
jgi:hypothetical protein